MIKAEMLNEMNPKLRALLAAGLIGTASLGAASCSMPTDDPTVYEQPAFETLGVADYAENLARATKIRSRDSNRDDKAKEFNVIQITYTNDIEHDVYVYRNGEFNVAIDLDNDKDDDASQTDGVTYICYKESNNRYYVPENKVNDFDTAIAAYKAAHAE